MSQRKKQKIKYYEKKINKINKKLPLVNGGSLSFILKEIKNKRNVFL